MSELKETGYEWVRKLTAEVLEQVVAGVKEAQAAGVAALMPDIVVFEVEVKGGTVYYEVPLDDEQPEEREIARKTALDAIRDGAKMNYSFPFAGN